VRYFSVIEHKQKSQKENGMIDNVIQFPGKLVRINNEMENIIRNALIKAGADQNTEDAITAKMVEYIKEYLNVSFTHQIKSDVFSSIPDELSNQLIKEIEICFGEIEKTIHEFTTRIAMERLLLEIKLYQ
jgi:lipopolysaccharide biosynthesis protein